MAQVVVEVSASTTLYRGSEPPFSNTVLGDPIILREDEPNTSEANVDYGSLHVESAELNAGGFDRPNPASNSRIPPPSSPQGCYVPSSRGLSEPLHCQMDREGLYTGRARSKAATSYASRPYN
jgi:hypothetical protein